MDHITARGSVKATLISPSGHSDVVSEDHNALMYGCADAVAALCTGDLARRPATLGFVYGQSSDLSAFMFDQESPDRGGRQSDIVGEGLSCEDVTLAPSPAISSSDRSHYSGNRVTFRAMSTGDSEVFIYGFLLKDGYNNLLAVRKLAAPVRRPAGYAVSADWSVSFY